MQLRDLAKYVFGLFLAVVLMVWVFRGTDPATLWGEIRNASILGLLLGGALNFGHNIFRVLRWRVLLTPLRRDIGFRPMFSAVVLGYMTSWIVPGRLGELVRPMLLSGREDLALGPVVGSIVADRVLDIVAIAFLFALGILTTPLTVEAAEHAALLRFGAVIMTAAATAVLVVMVAASVMGDRLARWFARRGRVLRWLGRAAVSLAHGAGAFRSVRAIVLLLLHSVAAWSMIAAGTWICIRAAGADVSAGTVLVILPMLVLGVAVPTPAGAGGYHGAMKAGLLLFGVSQVTAVSAGLLAHMMMTVPVIVTGVVLLWTEKVRWSDLIAAARRLRRLGDESATRLEGVS
ncbi:MAG: flippase-like domain-containing protein [Acidobacteria bacterium]|nr:flippase-like domain-containing protein [Acidobacteriota bacterium]NIM60295.1 flippase-like domain-containing protein [Acidobacteriota bacterium]NIQ85571.1 flippase-like domain-containing protein [Acidobacteriota bacterium]NIT11284.1 flippase-like domain-containing protein [Acidobacteriota bacterium]